MRNLALVTGASRGIGYAIAQYLASKNMDLILLSQHAEKLDQARQAIVTAHPACRVECYVVDMMKVQDVEDNVDMILKTHSPISVLVNSAGILGFGASEMPIPQLLDILTINLLSTLIVTNKVAAKMKREGGGHIFNIASLAGVENKSHLAVYSSSKSGLISYSQALYREMLQYGVNVTCLCPSVVNTDMTNDLLLNNEDKIQVSDIVLTVQYVLSLGKSAVVPHLEIHCKIMDIEEEGSALMGFDVW